VGSSSAADPVPLAAGESWAPMSTARGQEWPWAVAEDLQQRYDHLNDEISRLASSSPHGQMLVLTQEVYDYTRRLELYTQVVHQVSSCVQSLHNMQI
jgi:hypothetical protein